MRSILEKEKLIVLRSEKKEEVLDTPLADEPTERPACRRACDANLEVSCVMLGCMEPELQMQFETNHEAHDMIMVLQDMFQT